MSASTASKQLHRAVVSARDFRKAASFLAAAHSTTGMRTDWEACVLMAIICYARPFSRNERGKAPADPTLSGVNVGAIVGVDRTLHDRILTLRNKAVAHAESRFYPVKLVPPDPEDVAIGLTALSFDDSGTWHVHTEIIDYVTFAAMTDRMLRACYSRVCELEPIVAAELRVTSD